MSNQCKKCYSFGSMENGVCTMCGTQDTNYNAARASKETGQQPTPEEKDKAISETRLRGVGYLVFGGVLLYLASIEDFFLFGLPPNLMQAIYGIAGVVAALSGIHAMISGRDSLSEKKAIRIKQDY